VADRKRQRQRISRAFHPTDIAVGSRIRQRRLLLGWTQERLAAALNVTFQQVQKYERGANRVSASMLQEIADALETPVPYFFGHDEAPFDDIVKSRESLELIKAYYAMPSAVREKAMNLIRALAQAQQR
jgi:transcriptional regulator with XRE-family HTH domain